MWEAGVAEPEIIVDYEPVWPVRFAALRRLLRAALGELTLDLDHVGSTAKLAEEAQR
jgi:GrpB-like predicted nucleotidyltransferase (UPF0157 family)